MAVNPPWRVILYNVDTAAGRGRGALAAIIHDATDIGGSEYANSPGECFFTLPISHPQISVISPLTQHYRVDRYNTRTNAFETIFTGLLDDYEADEDEITFYGRDYLGLLETTISPSNTSYTDTLIGTIISSQLTEARAEANSRVNFITVGTIEATTTTTTVLTSYQPRLQFIAGLAEIVAADRSVRPIIQVTPRTSSGNFSFNFTENQGSDRKDVRLEYGGLITHFRYRPGYGDLRTRIAAIGQKREGATLLFSNQTYASEATYGWIAENAVFIDVVNQTALNDKTKRRARQRGQVGTGVGLVIRSNALAPWDGYDLGDSLPVVISRSIVSVNGLYTLWGLEWIGHPNGSEELFLDLLPKDT